MRQESTIRVTVCMSPHCHKFDDHYYKLHIQCNAYRPPYYAICIDKEDLHGLISLYHNPTGVQKCRPNVSHTTYWMQMLNNFQTCFTIRIRRKFLRTLFLIDPIAPKMCCYTTLWNVSVLKATIENNSTFVTTHFKTLTTGNTVFIV